MGCRALPGILPGRLLPAWGRGFEDWASLERERLGRRVLEALDALANGDLERGAFRSGIEHASRLLAFAPLNEGAHRTMMLLLACSGQRASALAQYETCRQVLMEELGVEPSPELPEPLELLAKGERPPGIPEVPGVEPASWKPSVSAHTAAWQPSGRRIRFFFGRGEFTERLHTAVRGQPMVAVIVGSSGSGKSSAVYAGLLPRLRQEDGWHITATVPARSHSRPCSAALCRCWNQI